MPDTARQRFNRKREIADPPPPAAELTALAERVGYGGNPEHKRNPGDFGLIPPSAPRADKTLCDAVNIFSRSAAAAALREGVRRGLVSRAVRGSFPQNIWSRHSWRPPAGGAARKSRSRHLSRLPDAGK